MHPFRKPLAPLILIPNAVDALADHLRLLSGNHLVERLQVLTVLVSGCTSRGSWLLFSRSDRRVHLLTTHPARGPPPDNRCIEHADFHAVSRMRLCRYHPHGVPPGVVGANGSAPDPYACVVDVKFAPVPTPPPPPGVHPINNR